MKIYRYPSDEGVKKVDDIAGRGLSFSEKLTDSVEEILEKVRTGGDTALMEYINRFDAPNLSPDEICVTENHIMTISFHKSIKMNQSLPGPAFPEFSDTSQPHV